MPVLVLYPDAKEIPMEDKKLFLIGEVAKMFHISMGTLRHYEQAGLLTPEYTDPDTRYRYYGTRQFELLNTIRYLRVLDFPLAQIKTFLDNRDTDVIEEKLVHQKEVIAKRTGADLPKDRPSPGTAFKKIFSGLRPDLSSFGSGRPL